MAGLPNVNVLRPARLGNYIRKPTCLSVLDFVVGFNVLAGVQLHLWSQSITLLPKPKCLSLASPLVAPDSPQANIEDKKDRRHSIALEAKRQHAVLQGFN